MHITASNSYSSINRLSENPVKQSHDLKENTASKSSQNKVEISNEAQKVTDTQNMLAQKYNVRAMTEGEMGALAKELKDAGLISSDEFAVMSFPRNKARENLGIEVDPNQKIDYLKESKDRLDYMISSSFNSSEINIQKGIYGMLTRLS